MWAPGDKGVWGHPHTTAGVPRRPGRTNRRIRNSVKGRLGTPTHDRRCPRRPGRTNRRSHVQRYFQLSLRVYRRLAPGGCAQRRMKGRPTTAGVPRRPGRTNRRSHAQRYFQLSLRMYRRLAPGVALDGMFKWAVWGPGENRTRPQVSPDGPAPRSTICPAGFASVSQIGSGGRAQRHV